MCKSRRVKPGDDITCLDRIPSHVVPAFAGTTWLMLPHTGSAIEYFTWLSAKLNSIEAMPSSRVSLFFRNAS